MDTTEKYILMSEKAVEIQKMHLPDKCEEGDIISLIGDEYYDGIYLYGCNGFKYDIPYYDLPEGRNGKAWQIYRGRTTDYISKDARIIWLPRQDQLQDMIKWEIDKRTRPGYKFWGSGKYQLSLFKPHDAEYGLGVEIWDAKKGTTFGDTQYFIKGNSMEQLWLAFVYREKYNKQWTGTEWTPIK